jgi:hypothetical protein
MKLTFDTFATYVFVGFFSLYAVIFWKMYDSVDDLNKNMATIVNELQHQVEKIKDHDSRIRQLETKDK